MEYDFYKVMNELLQWAETPSGALVFYPTIAVVTAAACWGVVRAKKWYDRNWAKPERKPFEDIATTKLPQSKAIL